MNQIILILAFCALSQTTNIFDFNKSSDLSGWFVVDDVVMGGRSSGNLEINDEGHALFYGDVSLENNGGFSSIRHRFDKISVQQFSKLSIKLKGDGKKYQFRVKSNKYERHSYIYEFETSGKWQTIEIPFSSMTPGFRGRRLNISNYSGKDLVEVAILIGNKTNESFKLEIDNISLI